MTAPVVQPPRLDLTKVTNAGSTFRMTARSNSPGLGRTTRSKKGGSDQLESPVMRHLTTLGNSLIKRRKDIVADAEADGGEGDAINGSTVFSHSDLNGSYKTLTSQSPGKAHRRDQRGQHISAQDNPLQAGGGYESGSKRRRPSQASSYGPYTNNSSFLPSNNGGGGLIPPGLNREYTEKEIQERPHLRRLNQVLAKLQMAEAIVSEWQELAPVRRVRSDDERHKQLISLEEAKLILFVGRKYNLEQRVEDMLDVVDSERVAKKRAESTHGGRRKGPGSVAALIVPAAPAPDASASAAAAASSPSIDAIDETKEMRDLRSRDRHFLNRQSEGDDFNVHDLHDLIDHIEGQLSRISHHVPDGNEDYSAKVRHELLRAITNYTDVCWLIESADLALMTDLGSMTGRGPIPEEDAAALPVISGAEAPAASTSAAAAASAPHSPQEVLQTDANASLSSDDRFEPIEVPHDVISKAADIFLTATGSEASPKQMLRMPSKGSEEFGTKSSMVNVDLEPSMVPFSLTEQLASPQKDPRFNMLGFMLDALPEEAVAEVRARTDLAVPHITPPGRADPTEYTEFADQNKREIWRTLDTTVLPLRPSTPAGMTEGRSICGDTTIQQLPSAHSQVTSIPFEADDASYSDLEDSEMDTMAGGGRAAPKVHELRVDLLQTLRQLYDQYDYDNLIEDRRSGLSKDGKSEADYIAEMQARLRRRANSKVATVTGDDDDLAAFGQRRHSHTHSTASRPSFATGPSMNSNGPLDSTHGTSDAQHHDSDGNREGEEGSPKTEIDLGDHSERVLMSERTHSGLVLTVVGKLTEADTARSLGGMLSDKKPIYFAKYIVRVKNEHGDMANQASLQIIKNKLENLKTAAEPGVQISGLTHKTLVNPGATKDMMVMIPSKSKKQVAFKDAIVFTGEHSSGFDTFSSLQPGKGGGGALDASMMSMSGDLNKYSAFGGKKKDKNGKDILDTPRTAAAKATAAADKKGGGKGKRGSQTGSAQGSESGDPLSKSKDGTRRRSGSKADGRRGSGADGELHGSERRKKKGGGGGSSGGGSRSNSPDLKKGGATASGQYKKYDGSDPYSAAGRKPGADGTLSSWNDGDASGTGKRRKSTSKPGGKHGGGGGLDDDDYDGLDEAKKKAGLFERRDVDEWGKPHDDKLKEALENNMITLSILQAAAAESGGFTKALVDALGLGGLPLDEELMKTMDPEEQAAYIMQVIEQVVAEEGAEREALLGLVPTLSQIQHVVKGQSDSEYSKGTGYAQPPLMLISSSQSKPLNAEEVLMYHSPNGPVVYDRFEAEDQYYAEQQRSMSRQSTHDGMSSQHGSKAVSFGGAEHGSPSGLIVGGDGSPFMDAAEMTPGNLSARSEGVFPLGAGFSTSTTMDGAGGSRTGQHRHGGVGGSPGVGGASGGAGGGPGTSGGHLSATEGSSLGGRSNALGGSRGGTKGSSTTGGGDRVGSAYVRDTETPATVIFSAEARKEAGERVHKAAVAKAKEHTAAKKAAATANDDGSPLTMPTIVYNIEEQQLFNTNIPLELGKAPGIYTARSNATGRMAVLVPEDGPDAATLEKMFRPKTGKSDAAGGRRVGASGGAASAAGGVELPKIIKGDEVRAGEDASQMTLKSKSTLCESQVSALMHSVRNPGKGAAGKEPRNDVERLEMEARELYMQDPTRYDAVVDQLLGLAMQRLGGQSGAELPNLEELLGIEQPPVSKQMPGGSAASGHGSPSTDPRTPGSALGGPFGTCHASGTSFTSGLDPSTPAEGTSALQLTLPRGRSDSGLFSSAIRRSSKSSTEGKTVLTGRTFGSGVAHPNNNNEEDDEEDKESYSGSALARASRKRVVVLEEVDASKEAAQHGLDDEEAGEEEIQRILYEQMKAKLLLQLIISQMRALWAKKERESSEKFRDKMDRTLTKAMGVSWDLQKYRVIQVRKLVHILDRRTGRVGGWIPYYTDDNVLVDENSSAECPHFVVHQTQRKIHHAMCLARRRKLLPIRLVQRDVLSSYHPHLLFGYRRQVLPDVAIAASLDLQNNNNSRSRQPFRPPTYGDMLDTGERARYRRRLQRAAPFQAPSKKYAPHTRRDADLPFALH